MRYADDKYITEGYAYVLLETSTFAKFFDGPEPIQYIHKELGLRHNVEIPLKQEGGNKLNLKEDLVRGVPLFIDNHDGTFVFVKKSNRQIFKGRGKGALEYDIYVFDSNSLVKHDRHETNPHTIMRDYMARHATIYSMAKSPEDTTGAIDHRMDVSAYGKISKKPKGREPGTFSTRQFAEEVSNKFRGVLQKQFRDNISVYKQAVMDALDNVDMYPSTGSLSEVINDYRKFLSSAKGDVKINTDDVTKFFQSGQHPLVKNYSYNEIKVDTKNEVPLMREFVKWYMKKLPRPDIQKAKVKLAGMI